MTSSTHVPHAAGEAAWRPGSPAILLVAGGVLIAMTFMRYSLAEFGWVVFSPFLTFVVARAVKPNL